MPNKKRPNPPITPKIISLIILILYKTVKESEILTERFFYLFSLDRSRNFSLMGEDSASGQRSWLPQEDAGATSLLSLWAVIGNIWFLATVLKQFRFVVRSLLFVDEPRTINYERTRQLKIGN